MKILTKILILVISLITLIQVKVGYLCLFNPAGAQEFFNLQSLGPDTEKILVVLGSFVWAVIALQALTIYWLVKKENAGYVISVFIGIITMLRGLLVMVFQDTEQNQNLRIIIIPIVFGLLILILAIVASKEHKTS